MKKILSLILCLVMLFSLFPVSAFAEEEEMAEPQTEQEEVLEVIEEEQEPDPIVEEPEEHTHDYVATVTAATCTEQGCTIHTCACGDSYVDGYVDALGHKEEEVDEIPSTCVEHGTAAGKVCSVCGEVLEGCGELPLAEHTPEDVAEVPAEPGKPGMTAGKRCSVCGAVLEGCEEIPAPEEPEVETVITIDKQPENAEIVDGEAVFEVAASVNTDAELTYQWQRLDESVEYVDEDAREAAWEDMENETGAELRLEGLDDETARDEAAKYAYRCVLTAGEKSEISNEARLLRYTEVAGNALLTSGDVVASGTCGENLTWKLDSVGKLTISGTGAMIDYSFRDTKAPWNEHTDSIYEVVISNGVMSIGNYAFCNCSSMTSVTIPTSVTSIGIDTFYRCSGLTSVTIPEGVTSIGDSAFSYCSNLTSVTIPEGVTSIGEWAFYNCSSLTSMTIPESVTSIGVYTFGSCKGLTRMTIPEGVTSIGGSAFSGCSNLMSVIIPEGVTSIGSSAFTGCSSLTSVTIPNSMTSIEERTFSDCSNLMNVTIPESVTSIGGYAFSDCSKLKSVTIPEGVTSIGDGAFYCCSGLTSLTISESVTSIGIRAFFYCSSLKSVTIPESVTSIGSEAFRACSSITSVTIPKSVTDIGNYAFGYCSSLTSVTILEGVTSIGSEAFRDCSSLTSVTIPASMTSIGYNAFKDCRFKTAGPIGGGYDYEFGWKEAIPAYAFYYCSNLMSVTIPASMTSIGSYAFDGCSSLTSVTIPEGVTSIGSFAFHDCSSLTSVTIPEGVTSIRNSTFYGCSRLTSVTIPEGVTSIGNYAFSDCSSLTSATIPEGVTSIDSSAFSGCSSLTSVTIPEGVTNIGKRAFYSCSSLTSVTILEGVTSIGSEAFKDCRNLTSVAIPESVTSIGGSAFYSCTGLKEVYYSGTQEEWGKIAIGTYNEPLTSATLHTRIPVSGVSLNQQTLQILINETAKLNAEVLPDNASDKSVIWTSSDPSIAAVSEDGTVTAVKRGTATIQVTTNDGGKTAACTVEVIVPVAGVSLDMKFLTMREGKSHKLGAIISPSDATDQMVTWTSSDPSIAKVSEDGTVTAVKGGTATITVTTNDGGKTATCTVTVTCKVTGVTLREKLILNQYERKKLEATVLPENAEDKRVTWSSSDPTVATVSADGTVTGVSPGRTTITVTTVDGGKKATCEVRVLEVNNCGKNVYWSLTDSILRITGSGPMFDYDIDNPAHYPPWLGITVTATDGSETKVPDITVVTINEGVTNIGTCAFDSCSLIRVVLLPESLESIGSFAFAGCTSLETVVIPDRVTSIGEGAFALSGLQVLRLPRQLTTVSRGCFREATDLTDVILPDSITAIEDEAFRGCSALKNVELPPNLKSIGEEAFAFCQSMTDLTLPNGVTSLGEKAFSYCSGILTVSIPSSVPSIPGAAFAYCSVLSSVEFPASIKSIGSIAFQGCINLEKFSLKGNMPSIAENAFEDVTAMAYYPSTNTTYSPDQMRNYGGKLTWIGDDTPNLSIYALTNNQSILIKFETAPVASNNVSNYIVKNSTGKVFPLSYVGNAQGETGVPNTFKLNFPDPLPADKYFVTMKNNDSTCEFEISLHLSTYRIVNSRNVIIQLNEPIIGCTTAENYEFHTLSGEVIPVTSAVSAFQEIGGEAPNVFRLTTAKDLQPGTTYVVETRGMSWNGKECQGTIAYITP